jgi:hypothetical protein
MKKIRIAILVFFIAVAALFSYKYLNRRIAVDYQPPVITADSDSIMVGIAATEEDLLKGMTANDNIDGDVTGTLVVLSKSKFISKGTVRVKYAAFDSNRNVGLYTREITYIDYVSPRFHLDAPLRFISSSASGGYDYLEHITAQDCLDGNISQHIKMTMGKITPISSTANLQTINLQVTNSCGDSSVLELTVSVEDYSTYTLASPALKEYITYVPKGGKIDLMSFPNGIWAGGAAKSFKGSPYDIGNVTYSAPTLDLNKPGAYTVTYQLTSSAGEQLGTATLIVIVEE